MKTGKLARGLLLALAALAVLAAFAVLDWYPMVKELGRLRRERGDLELTIKDYSAAAGKFEFPGAVEETLLADTDAELGRVLPQVDNNDAWAAISIFDLQSRVRENNIPHARFLFNWQVNGMELGAADAAGVDSMTHWIDERFGEIQEGFSLAFDQKNFLWRDLLVRMESHRFRLASRPLCVVVMAPLPALLGFINHLSWGEARLEIVRMRLEPGFPFSRVWLVCRGNYLVPGPSQWQVKTELGKGGEELLIDLDSPLLLRKADLLLAPRVEKRELPPAGSPW